MTTLRLATRRSTLALAQARAYAATLQHNHQGLEIEEVQIVTSGDKFQDRPLQALGGKGLFIKEIEEALLDGRADMAVHSIKDVPAELAPALCIACVPTREDPRDVLVSREGHRLADLPAKARLGTSSLRRSAMLLIERPDLEVLPLRGNVDTRLRKLREGQVDAIVLAAAGLERLGRAAEATELIAPEVCLPAVGQGALGIECRADNETVRALVASTNDRYAQLCVSAERGFMDSVGGSCRLPVAAYCIRQDSELWIRGMVANEDCSNLRRNELRVPWSDDEQRAEQAGRQLGVSLQG